jgi:hypothetical protein
MTLDAVITMIIVLCGVWGGFVLFITKVLREESRNSDY